MSNNKNCLRLPDEIAREMVKGGIDELELVLEDDQEAAILMCRKNHRTSTYEKTVRIIARLIDRIRAEAAAAATPEASPIPMLIWCPMCKERHIDRGEFATKPHHTHSCQRCGLTWRPAVVPTVGVRYLPGFKDDAEEPAVAKAPGSVPKPIQLEPFTINITGDVSPERVAAEVKSILANAAAVSGAVPGYDPGPEGA